MLFIQDDGDGDQIALEGPHLPPWADNQRFAIFVMGRIETQPVVEHEPTLPVHEVPQSVVQVSGGQNNVTALATGEMNYGKGGKIPVAGKGEQPVSPPRKNARIQPLVGEKNRTTKQLLTSEEIFVVSLPKTDSQCLQQSIGHAEQALGESEIGLPLRRSRCQAGFEG